MAITGCEALMPTTEDANSRFHSRIIPEYVKYVQTDEQLKPIQKKQKINTVKSYNYDMLCRIVIPDYIRYVEADPHITDRDIRQAIIINAQSYADLNNHYNRRE